MAGNENTHLNKSSARELDAPEIALAISAAVAELPSAVGEFRISMFKPIATFWSVMASASNFESFRRYSRP